MSTRAEATWLSLKVFSPALALFVVGIAGPMFQWLSSTPAACRLCAAAGFAYMGVVCLCGSDELVLALGRVSLRNRARPVRSCRREGAALLVVAALQAASALLP